MKINSPSVRLGALCGAAALTFGLVLTGCGGGGSGPRTVPITPTTSPTSSGVCSTQYTPNYASSVRLLHWTSFPLRVFFVRNAQYSAARQALAVQGFNKWVQATNSGVTYTIVNSTAASNIQVSFFVFTGGPRDTLGTTQLSFYDQSSTIVNADISLGLTGVTRNDVITANHEFGHALGIFGHSPDEQDLMYFEGNDAFSGEITPSDLNTVLTAYCGNFPQNLTNRSAHQGELKTVTIHDTFGEILGKTEASR